jgi:hypothetical protein
MVKEVKEDNSTQADGDRVLQSFQSTHGRDWPGNLRDDVPGSSVILRLRLSSTMGRRNFSDHRHRTIGIAKHEMNVFIIFKLECQQDRIEGYRGSLRLAALVEIRRALQGPQLGYRDRTTILEPWIVAQYLDGPSFFAAGPSAGSANQHQHESGESFGSHAGECSSAPRGLQVSSWQGHKNAGVRGSFSIARACA